MSGSTIGGVVGAFVGFWFGNPQLGWMIGSAIGGAIDPEVIKGPRINDAQTQTSNDGVPRPIVYGVAAFAGNVIARGNLTHRTVTTSQGKGGPEVEEDHVFLTYAIRICEGPVDGIRRVWRDDKLVYDASNLMDRPEIDRGDALGPLVYQAEMAAFSASFQSKATFYLGGEDQLPDPSLEAIFGAGETPAYRGTCYVVIKDDDLTERRGSIPQYRFEVVSNGTTATEDNSEIEVPRLSAFRNQHWPLVDDEASYTYSGSQVLADGSDLTYSASTIQAILDYFAANNGYGFAQNVFMGYSYAQSRSAVTTKGFDITVTQSSVVMNEKLTLLYNHAEPETWYPAEGTSGDTCITIPSTTGVWYGLFDGSIVRRGDLGTLRGYYSCDDTTLAGLPPIVITVSRTEISPSPTNHIPMPDVDGYSLDADGAVVKDKTYTLTAGTYKQLGLDVLENIPGEGLGVNRYAYFQVGPILASTDPDYSNQAYWDAAYADAVAAGTIASGMTYSSTGASGPNTYPQLVSEAYVSASSFTTISPDSVFLSDVVLDIADRVGVDSSQMDVTDLSGMTVRGYYLGRQMEASGALRGLQTPYLFDMPEWDGKVHCVLRGGAIKATITDDDLLESEDEEDFRAQSLEFPRKLHVAYPDPSKAYAVTKQTSERRSSQVKADSETGVELSLSLYGSEAATIAHRLHKIAWADAEGGAKISLPEEFSYLCPSDCIERNGKRFRIEGKESGDGQNVLDLKFDRTSAYTGSVDGGQAPTPTDPVTGNLKGPTVFAAMNLQNLRTQDSGPGIYVAVCGILSGWPGCDLKLSTDGGTTFRSVAKITTPSKIGVLTADITSSTDPISVRMYGTELDSATAAQIELGANAFAIVDPDFNVEAGQFTTATLVSDDTYEVSTITRGLLETDADAHFEGNKFVMLESAIFIPLDASLGGTTLIFKPVTGGTPDANNATYEVVFDPPTFVRHGGVVTPP